MDQATGNQIAAQLGATSQRLQELRVLPFETAQLRLEELKKEARSRYRKLVFKHHPDRNPGDPDSAQTLKDLAEVLRMVEGLTIRRAAPPPPMLTQVRYVYVSYPPTTPFASTAPSYNTNTGTTSTTYQAGRVAFVRPV
jgi:DnaJ-like protein